MAGKNYDENLGGFGLMSIAEKLKSPRGRRGEVSETDEKKVAKRVSSARNHMLKLCAIAPQLDPEDYTSIRDSLIPVIETFVKQYERKSVPAASTKEKTSA